MLLDMASGKRVELENLKGGAGKALSTTFSDERVRIAYNILEPGGSIGYHKHEGSCEIVYVLSGVATFRTDSGVEHVRVGQVHYCPEGASHSCANDEEDDLVIFCVIPTLS
jgi:quercetin dioxygenase-like cupin family protein